MLKRCLEDPLKVLFLSCQSCGDCAIQHVAFLCPESGCPKHTRNGPCGGSWEGACEVYPEKQCLWVRAYGRLKHANRLSCFMEDKVPPRMWEPEQNLRLGQLPSGKRSSTMNRCWIAYADDQNIKNGNRKNIFESSHLFVPAQRQKPLLEID